MNLKIHILLILFIIGTTLRLNALLQISVSGSYTETIDSTDLINFYLPTTYTSALNAVIVDIDAANNEKWLVSVYKSDTNWDTSLHLSIRRTGSGTGSGKVIGGDSFQEVTSVSQSFMNGQKALSNIPVQVQISGVSYQISPDTYGTTITYTITDY